MLKINMFSSADKVKGQGVGSAYNELVELLENFFPNELKITINQLKKVDISHYHTIDPQYYLASFLPNRGVNVGYVHFLPETIEGSLQLPKVIKWIFYKYMIAFYKRMDALVVVNPTFIPKLTAYGIEKQKITYIPNFVSTKTFYPQTKQQKLDLRQKYTIAEDKFVVLGVGQVQQRKGVLDFVQLAKENPDMQFIWVGGFSFGKMTDGYQQLSRIVDNPPANLLFTGIVDRQKMNEYYNIADIFLLPSYNELFPMSILEAFSCNVAVMVRDLELYDAVISDYYEPAQDVEQMGFKLNELKDSPEKLALLQQKSKKAASYYSEQRLAEIWKKYYAKLVGE